MDIRLILNTMSPGAAWRNGPLTGDLPTDYAAIIWEDESPQPSLADMQAGATQIELDAARADAITDINTEAGEQRSRYATNIPFQGDVYQLKEREAIGYQQNPTAPASTYPLLYSEAAARGITPATLATEYLTNAAIFPQILGAIEGVRMSAITAIKNAATITEIETALASVTWPEF